jgi:hypothetical protein
MDRTSFTVLATMATLILSVVGCGGSSSGPSPSGYDINATYPDFVNQKEVLRQNGFSLNRADYDAQARALNPDQLVRVHGLLLNYVRTGRILKIRLEAANDVNTPRLNMDLEQGERALSAVRAVRDQRTHGGGGVIVRPGSSPGTGHPLTGLPGRHGPEVESHPRFPLERQELEAHGHPADLIDRHEGF